MARVVPSMVVKALEQAFPWAKTLADGEGSNSYGLGVEHAVIVGTVASLIDQIPGELYPVDADDHFRLVGCLGAMRAAGIAWSGGGHPSLAPKLDVIKALGKLHPLAICIQVLRRCPDETPHATTPDLLFLPSDDVRRSIRVDVANAYRALGNGEFKAATVLAGSVIEALLLFRLQSEDKTAIETARSKVDDDRKARGKALVRKGDLEDLVLTDYADLAAELRILDEEGHQSILLSNGFRNLIHPGRVLRKGEDASQATALLALGALARLIDRLTV